MTECERIIEQGFLPASFFREEEIWVRRYSNGRTDLESEVAIVVC